MTDEAHNDKTNLPSGGHTQDAAEHFHIGTLDREVLRRLAGEVAELAARPAEAQRRSRWYALNALQPGRPLVFCDPENGWNEIITPDQLQCSGALARTWEMTLRKEVFWGSAMGDDRVCEGHFIVNHLVAESRGWGLEAVQHKADAQGSYTWDAPLQSYETDLPRLALWSLQVDHDGTQRLVALAEETLGDLLEVKLKGDWRWTTQMTLWAITLRGLERFMLDMYLEPEGLKALMKHLSNGTMAMLDDLGKQGALTLNNDGSYVGSGGFGYTNDLPQDDFDGRVRTPDMWGFCESQETASISAALFEEFVFPYQMPIMSRFGLNCYGCCEPLHQRWHIVKQFPNLRRVSVSPWADFEAMAEHLGDKYIYSFKPNPAPLAVPDLDEDAVRKQIRHVLHVAKNCRIEIIMKDNHTIGKNPRNVTDWCRIAQQEAEAF